MFEHLFLLFVFTGLEPNKKLESQDMYFRNLNECVFFAKELHKQGETITSYCLPRFVNSNNVKVY